VRSQREAGIGADAKSSEADLGGRTGYGIRNGFHSKTKQKLEKQKAEIHVIGFRLIAN
jgi:hypothetical protein